MKNKNTLILLFLLALIISAVVGFGAYHWQSAKQEKSTKTDTQLIIQDAANVVNKQFDTWYQATKDIDTMPNKAPLGATMRLLPAQGMPSYLSYSEQDLLARTRQGNTGAEVTTSSGEVNPTDTQNISGKNYSIVKPLPSGEYLLLSFSFNDLKKELSTMVSAHQQLGLNKTTDGSVVSAFSINQVKPYSITDRTLNDSNWFVSASYDIPSATISPLYIGAATFVALLLLLGAPPLLKIKQLDVQARKQQAQIQAQKERSKHKAKTTKPISTQGLPLEQLSDSVEPMAKPKSGDPLYTRQAQKPEDDTEAEASNLLDELDSETKSDDALAESGRDKPQREEGKSNIVAFNPPNLDELASQTEELETHSHDESHIIEFGSKSSHTLSKAQQSLFRAYDIRGNAELIDDNFISLLAKAFATVFEKQKNHEVVIGHDTRQTSSPIVQQLTKSLNEQGVNVVNIGLATTAITAFAAKRTSGNGIMVTASHSDISQNGFKWFVNNKQATKDEVNQLKTLILSEDFSQPPLMSASEQARSFNQDYTEEVEADILLNNLPRVSIDCMHGATGVLAAELFENAGCAVHIYNNNTNGRFTTGNPDPTAPNRLNALCANVISDGSDAGFAFDCDGDRLVVVDNKGRILDGELLLSLFANMVLETNPAADFLFDIKCSRELNHTVTDCGGRPVVLPTGSAKMKEKLFSDEANAVFAGEYSGHFIFNDGRLGQHDDAMYAALRLLEWLGEQSQSLAEIVDEQPKLISTADTYIKSGSEKTPAAVIDALIEQYATTSDAQNDVILDDTDGFRLDFPYGFGIIRSSNTSDAFSVRFAAQDEKSLAKILNRFITLTKAHDEMLAKAIFSIEGIKTQT